MPLARSMTLSLRVLSMRWLEEERGRLKRSVVPAGMPVTAPEGMLNSDGGVYETLS